MKVVYHIYDPAGNITVLAEIAALLNPEEFPINMEVPGLGKLLIHVAESLMREIPEAEQIGFVFPPASGGITARLMMTGGEFCGNASVSLGIHIMRKRRGPLPVYLFEPVTESYQFEVSGAKSPVPVNITIDNTRVAIGTVEMPLPTRIVEKDFYLVKAQQRRDRKTPPPAPVRLPVVSLPGIDHIIVPRAHEVFRRCTDAKIEKLFKRWTQELDSKAFGLMLLDEDIISESEAQQQRNGEPHPVAFNMRPLLYVPVAGTLVWENACGSGSAAIAAWKAMSLREPVEMDIVQPGGTIHARADISASVNSETGATEEICRNQTDDAPVSDEYDSTVSITNLSIRVCVKHIDTGYIDF